MTQQSVALPVADASSFAKALRTQLQARFEIKPTVPGHVELLNMLAYAAGFRNFQTLKAAPPAATSTRHESTSTQRTEPSATLTDTARKALGQFDDHGRLIRLPVKFSVQRMVMWALWLHLPAKRVMSEREVNEILKVWNTFGDHVTPRRELINMQLMSRKDDCSDYQKMPARPSEEIAAFLKAYRELLPKARSMAGTG
jgi:hypothetical protein